MKVIVEYLVSHTMELEIPVFDDATAIAEARNEYRRLAKNSNGKMLPHPTRIGVAETGAMVA